MHHLAIQVIKPLRHFVERPYLAGYTGPVSNFVMVVKEAVENSLDACEEAGILPDILVDIQQVEEGVYRITVADNGPGISADLIETAFCKLSSSKAFRYRQTRGTMGVGIKVALGLSTRLQARPIKTITKTEGEKDYNGFVWRLDYNNEKMAIVEKRVGPLETVLDIIESDFVKEKYSSKSGLILEFFFPNLRFTEKVVDYLHRLYLINPHINLRARTPKGDCFNWKRVIDVPPNPPVEIKPPIKSATVGGLIQLFGEKKEEKTATVLRKYFHGFTPTNQRKLAEELKKHGLQDVLKEKAGNVSHAAAEKIIQAIAKLKQPKYGQCLSLVGEDNIIRTVKQVYGDERVRFVDCVSRHGQYGGGLPFAVECALAEIDGLGGWEIYRYANRCPILIHESKCDIYQLVKERIKWNTYGITETSPVLFLIHIASVHLPFLSTAKTALILPDEIYREITLALQELGRRYNRRVTKRAEREKKVQRGKQLYVLLNRLAEEATLLARKKEKPDIRNTFIKIVGKAVAEEVLKGEK